MLLVIELVGKYSACRVDYNTLWQCPYFPKNDVIEIAETGAKVDDQCGDRLLRLGLNIYPKSVLQFLRLVRSRHF